MERTNKKSQLVKMFLLLSFLFLLIIIPFISPPLRSPYLYFLFNLLVVSLAVEAGLLASFSKPHVDIDKNNQPFVVRKEDVAIITHKKEVVEEKRDNRVEEHASLAIKSVVVEAVERVKKLTRCPSRPSIFFIGSCDGDLVEEDQQQVVVVEEEILGELSTQELFSKAEMFIGNFYKQLKMQRQESWNKLHVS